MSNLSPRFGPRSMAMRVMRVWLIALLVQAALYTEACEPQKVAKMEHAISRFTYPLFDVRQAEAQHTPRDVLSHIRQIVRTEVEQLDHNYLLLCKAAGLDLEDCNTCKYFYSDAFREELVQATQLLFQLQQLRAFPIAQDKRLVVVGSGPAGLIAAVHSAIFGLNTTVVESREARTRNIWFDLATEAENAPARELLEALGGRFTNMRIQEHPGTNMISVRCQELERFLAKTVLFLGGDIVAGASVTAVQGGNSSTSWYVEATAGSSARKFGFDLLVLAEGHSGHLLRQLGIESVNQQVIELPSPFSWLQLEGEWQNSTSYQQRLQEIQYVQTWLRDRTFTPNHKFDRELFVVDGLHQTTLIAKFSPMSNGECPPLRLNQTEVLDPFVPGAVIDGVTSVFKRFFYSYCELQVLLDYDTGVRVQAEYESAQGNISSLPADSELWATLVQTWKLLLGDGDDKMEAVDLATPSATRQWLSNHLGSAAQMSAARDIAVQQLRKTSAGGVDVRVLQLKVDMTPTTTGMLMAKQPPYSAVPVGSGSSTRSGKRPAVIVLGDASVTSHYRLGVGVNHAVRTAHDLRKVLHVMRGQNVAVDIHGEIISSSPRVVYNALADFHGKAVYRNYALVQYQLFAMFFEAYCGAVAYGNQLYRPVPGTYEFTEVSASELQCTQPLQPIFAQ